MSSSDSDIAMREIVNAGLPCYLNVLYAVYRFQDEITTIAERVLRENLDELCRALAVQAPPPASVQRYSAPGPLSPSWDGKWGWLAASAKFGAPMWHTCYLGLTFDSSQPEPDKTQAHITFMHQLWTKSRYASLRPSFLSHSDRHDNPQEKELGFSWPLRNPDNIEEDVQKMARRAIEFWTTTGGWQKLIPSGDPTGS